ncbi:response regulator [Cohnella herbarum]|uniref:Response regulator n=1 Tax=Cohnella herbarum TaxID=2728023 RepID=A0A7Z2VNF8_9BACL|nr:response regulator [Cohnella herbarum]QJD86192.1 response regulator [Cohnella herbarum]
MKIVVVEDEVLVRRGIVSGIPWAEHGIEVVGDASDGRTGLELVRSLKPDMVITDIQMPIMDGLEMIRHIRKEFPDMIVMILSVREDFRSVQDAIRLGVIDYVHKLTMSPEELLESVLQAKDSRSVQEKPTEAIDHGTLSVSSNSLTDWLEVATADNEPAPREEEINGGRRYSVGIIRTTGDNREHLARLLLDSTAHKGLREAKMHQNDREAVFIATANGDGDDGKLILERWKDDLADAIHRLGDEGQCLSVAISPLHLDKQDKLQAYHEALEALSLRFYTGPGYVHVYANRVLGSERELNDSYASFVSPMAIRAYLAALEQTDEAFARLRFEELFPLRPPEGMPPHLVRDRIVQWQSSVTLLLGEWGLPLTGCGRTARPSTD